MNLTDYQARFDEEPGYLDYARVAPMGRAALEEQTALASVLAHARFGSVAGLLAQHDRMRAAVAALGGFRPDQVVFQPNASTGLLHTMFGITGGVAVSPREFPSMTYAVQRAADALGVLAPLWLETDDGRVTPGNLRDQLTPSVVAVAVSLVDYRTGYLVDLDGIRQVIGDRLLIVDAAQGFGIVDAPYEVTDVVVSGGQKWTRAGIGSGFLAVSDRARDHLTPVWSSFAGSRDPYAPTVEPAAEGAAAYQVSHADPVAAGRFAAALEEIAAVGIPVLHREIAHNVSRLIDLADEYAVPVVSPRAEAERAGIVVLEPSPEQLTVLAASLHNHGVTATVRDTTVRLSAHATVEEETFSMLRAALVSFATTI
ncbi:aminotransferase class V-fold PLP-dependent enzyme [Pseudolysinimonas sp.]|jgi:selenocysteine lyase/cysteine desulfurase|uniref:aminotransferase class V-fold PLP-dependent enzyme n=1 Tax=Pseudolysinimonas sp. TaxID=2680009 RepID=UPI003782DD22